MYDFSPDPQSLIRGWHNEEFPPAEALAELIDNSFGQGVGDATLVRITWDKKSRTQTILDNGNGMPEQDNVGLLLKIGGHVGDIKNISEYGYGGTKAIVHLGTRVQIDTLRDGWHARATVEWDKIRALSDMRVDNSWHLATSRRVPSDLLAFSHGTRIKLWVPTKRRISENNIRRDLARLFAPGLRRGLRIEWVSDGAITELAAPPLPKIDVHLDVAFEHDGRTLRAKGMAAYTEGVSRDQSGIDVGFYARNILSRNKAAFRTAEGDAVDGTGIVGYVELEPGWQGYLTTTKRGFDDDIARKKLIDGLAEQLSPLLSFVSRQQSRVLFKDIALELEGIFDGRVGATVETPESPDGDLIPDPDGTEVISDGDGEGGDGPARQPAARHAGRVAEIRIIPQTDREMSGHLFAVQVLDESDPIQILAYVNKDHEDSRRAYQADPPERFALVYGICRELADAVWASERARTKLLRPSLRSELELLPDHLVVGALTRALIDNRAA